MATRTQKVIDTLLDWGADLVGIAPVERFANAPEGHKPTDFLPGCKSVISVALHIFQGAADVWGDLDQSGKNSKKLAAKEMKDYDLSKRHSSVARFSL